MLAGLGDDDDGAKPEKVFTGVGEKLFTYGRRSVSSGLFDFSVLFRLFFGVMVVESLGVFVTCSAPNRDYNW